MSGLSAFLKGSKKAEESIKIVASKSFVDEKGKPIEWEARALKSKEMNAIRTECTSIKKGNTIEVDSGKFNAKVAAKCTVYPNLNDKDLQDSYGVMGAEDLIQEMLDNAGEYQSYCKEIMRISGFDKSDSELVTEAKN